MSAQPCAKTIERRWGWRELLAEAVSVRPNDIRSDSGLSRRTRARRSQVSGPTRRLVTSKPRELAVIVSTLRPACAATGFLGQVATASSRSTDETAAARNCTGLSGSCTDPGQYTRTTRTPARAARSVGCSGAVVSVGQIRYG